VQIQVKKIKQGTRM